MDTARDRRSGHAIQVDIQPDEPRPRSRAKGRAHPKAQEERPGSKAEARATEKKKIAARRQVRLRSTPAHTLTIYICAAVPNIVKHNLQPRVQNIVFALTRGTFDNAVGRHGSERTNRATRSTHTKYTSCGASRQILNVPGERFWSFITGAKPAKHGM